MTVKEFHELWLRHNMFGQGPAKRKLNDHYRYAGNVLLWNNQASCRMIQRYDGTWVKLYKWHLEAVPDELKGKCLQMSAPDLGVWSRFDDDQISDAELHVRNQFLMVSEVAEYIAETLPNQTDESLAGDNYLDGVNRQLNIWSERYSKYSDVFNLHWQELPDAFWQQARAIAKAKYNRFNDPAAVAKRNRAKARRITMKALGLDKKSA